MNGLLALRTVAGQRRQSFNPNGYPVYRFNVTTLRGPVIAYMQYMEFQLLDSTGTPITGATATTASGVSYGTSPAQGPAQAIDGDLTTKFCTISSGAAPLILTFASAKKPASYRFCTGNDSTERDPISWSLDGSTDGTTWTTLNSQSNYATPTARSTYTSTFPLPFS